MKQQVRLAFIGAGQVNFGGGEGPWDHASRFEQIPGVACIAVADVDRQRADAVIATRQAGPHRAAWRDCRPFADWREMVQATAPDAVVIGLPPDRHGRLEPPNDVELTLARAGIAMLIEKPLGNGAPQELAQVADALEKHEVIASVGYMFRYSAAIERMRELLTQQSTGPRVFLARYNAAYSRIHKRAFWDSRQTGGPIIEQATHFLDLARYLCGEVDLASVAVARITAGDEPGHLADMPRDDRGQALESDVPEQHRIPRATLAQWRFASGALGSLAHAVLLHQQRYEAELEVWADGLRCVLTDPYGSPRLGVRRSGSEQTQWLAFDDDPYMAQDLTFIEAVRQGATPNTIRSTYADALRTYALSFAITAS